MFIAPWLLGFAALTLSLFAQNSPPASCERLASLALPGVVPAQLAFLPRNPLLRRVARRARALKKAAIG